MYKANSTLHDVAKGLLTRLSTALATKKSTKALGKK